MGFFYKLLLIISSLFLLILPSIIFANSEGCVQHPTYLLPLSDAQKKKLIKEIANPDLNVDELGDIYLLNDHSKQQAIVVDDVGGIFAFEKKSRGWTKFDPILTDDNGVNADIYNPLTTKTGVVTQLCGNTYISLVESHYILPDHDTYLWRDGKISNSCDENFTNYQRVLFKTLLKQHLYSNAAWHQDLYLSDCKSQLDPQLYLWMKNDIALAQLKARNAVAANITLTQIETNPNLKNATLDLKSAIEFNKKLCQAEMIKPTVFDKPLGNFAFSWMLDDKAWEMDENNYSYYGAPYNPVTVAKLLELPSQLVPDIAVSILYANEPEMSTCNMSLQDYLANELLINGNLNQDKYKNRYIILDSDQGNVPDSSTANSLSDPAARHVFFWIDTLMGTSVVGSFEEGDGLYITSRNYSPITMPQQAKQDISSLYKTYWDQKPFASPIHFYDMSTKKNVTLPSSWLKPKN